MMCKVMWKDRPQRGGQSSGENAAYDAMLRDVLAQSAQEEDLSFGEYLVLTRSL